MFRIFGNRRNSSNSTNTSTSSTSSRGSSEPTPANTSRQPPQHQQQQQQPHFNMFGGGGAGGLFNNISSYAQQFEQQQMQAAMAASLRESQRPSPTHEETQGGGPPPTEKSVLAQLHETCLDMDDLANGNENCTVCFERQHVGDLAIKLKCGHCFHKGCVWPWLEKHSTCPVCRLELNTSSTNSMGRREEIMRKAHLKNIEQRRKQHTQTVAESRQRMQKMAREEAEAQQFAAKSDSNSNNNNHHHHNNNMMAAAIKSLLTQLGLDMPRANNDMNILMATIHNACDEEKLRQLKVRELKRRLEHLSIDTSMFLEKSTMISTLAKKSRQLVISSKFGDERK
jgi:hypothetical protein